jgi:hypothetical protein
VRGPNESSAGRSVIVSANASTTPAALYTGHVRDRDDRRDLEREEADRGRQAREQTRRADQVERLHDRFATVAQAREQRAELHEDVHGLGHAHGHEQVRHRAEHHVELPAHERHERDRPDHAICTIASGPSTPTTERRNSASTTPITPTRASGGIRSRAR